MLAQAAVERAYREAAIKRIGATYTADELAEGLDRLNGFLFSLFGGEISEVLFDWQVPNVQRSTTNPADPIVFSYPQNLSTFDQPGGPGGDVTEQGQITIPANTRVVWRGSTATTVYLPEYPGDGARVGLADVGSSATLTLDANGRQIEGAATKVITSPAAAAEWFYRADLGEWIPITELALTDSLPLPAGFDRLIICGTAIALTGLDQIEPTTGTMITYNRLLKLCKQRYTQRANTTYGGQNLPAADQSFDTYGQAARGWMG
jgi:hypothetical protein